MPLTQKDTCKQKMTGLQKLPDDVIDTLKTDFMYLIN